MKENIIKKLFKIYLVELGALTHTNQIWFNLLSPCEQGYLGDQVVIAQWSARRLATEEVPGSNLGKGKNLLISNYRRNLLIQF